MVAIGLAEIIVLVLCLGLPLLLAGGVLVLFLTGAFTSKGNKQPHQRDNE